MWIVGTVPVICIYCVFQWLMQCHQARLVGGWLLENLSVDLDASSLGIQTNKGLPSRTGACRGPV
jgi:hypothetical protein